MLTIRKVLIIAAGVLSIEGCADSAVQQPIKSNPHQQSKTVESDVRTVTEDQSLTTLSESDLDLCYNILHGKAILSSLPLQDPARNSFYLDCSLGIFIGTVKATKADHESARDVQIRNAAYLFTRNIDPNYISANGGGLIFLVIGSNLSGADKMAWVKKLVAEGADINYMNEYGNEALRAAEFSKELEIYDWLISKGARHSQSKSPQ